MAGRKASIRAVALTTVSMGTGNETLFQPSSAWVCAQFRAGDATLPAAGQLAARSAFFAEPASAGTFTPGTAPCGARIRRTAASYRAGILAAIGIPDGGRR